jgi:hypothetical protein
MSTNPLFMIISIDYVWPLRCVIGLINALIKVSFCIYFARKVARNMLRMFRVVCYEISGYPNIMLPSENADKLIVAR